jgi:hypothetical protein
VSKECRIIHELLQTTKRYRFPFDETSIPLNGVYILFQKGEVSHNHDRIVRIGTHSGSNRLALRINEHFVTENKDRSIFRKNIGRALLNRDNDPFLASWNIDLTTKKSKDKYQNQIDLEYQAQVEKMVSNFIVENFSFSVVEVLEKHDRDYMEKRLISTVSLCNECRPSRQWLGNYAPARQHKIKESGLWQIMHLYKTPFNSSTINEFRSLVQC